MSIQEEIIIKLGEKAGFSIKKGFKRYIVGGCIAVDDDGKRLGGYIIEDTASNNTVVGGFDNICKYTFTLDDVEEFIKDVYDEADLDYYEEREYISEHI